MQPRWLEKIISLIQRYLGSITGRGTGEGWMWAGLLVSELALPPARGLLHQVGMSTLGKLSLRDEGSLREGGSPGSGHPAGLQTAPVEVTSKKPALFMPLLDYRNALLPWKMRGHEATS